ncbi:MAG: hypothetical protein RLZZ597_3509 [Cyanobacteriota bacterium]|jgi:hypothetical protein
MALHSHRERDNYTLEELNIRQQIIALWIVFLLGLLFHTQLALMPLFHGLSVLAPHGQVATSITEVVPILWGMLAFFLLPLLAILATVLAPTRRFRQAHFWGTLLYTVLNIGHLVADLVVKPIAWYQIVLMVLLVLVGLLLNYVGYGWMRRAASRPPRLSLV